MAKPTRAPELHYPMIKFLIKNNIGLQKNLYNTITIDINILK